MKQNRIKHNYHSELKPTIIAINKNHIYQKPFKLPRHQFLPLCFFISGAILIQLFL